MISIIKEQEEKVFHKTSINWYPGHMAKAKRLIKESINLIDIVIHVADARIPYSSYIEDVTNILKNKPQIIYMSKYDLCDKEETEKWITYYKNKGYEVLACDSKKGKNYLKIYELIDKIMRPINEKRLAKGLLEKKCTIIVVGATNVGKSTLINKLVNKKIAQVENRPGVTKTINKIKLNEKIDLIDTPGVLMPKIKDTTVAYNLASMSIIKEEIIPIEDIAIHILKTLSKYYKGIYKKLYGEIYYDEYNWFEVYENIGKLRNIPPYNGEPNYERINNIIINDIKSERIKNITFDRLI